MPTAPPRICNRCHQPTPARGPCQCRPPYEGSQHPGNTDLRWRRLASAYRKRHTQCEVTGCQAPTANIDHKQTWIEHPELRYEWRNLMALCQSHATIKNTADAQRGRTRTR